MVCDGCGKDKHWSEFSLDGQRSHVNKKCHTCNRKRRKRKYKKEKEEKEIKKRAKLAEVREGIKDYFKEQKWVKK